MGDDNPTKSGDRPASQPAAPSKPDGARRDADEPRRQPAHKLDQAPGEVGGTAGPEPTRYGDWSHKGICSDF